MPYCISESCSIVSDSLWPHRLYSPWNSPGQNAGMSKYWKISRGPSHPGVEPRSPPLQVDSLPTELPGNWLAAFNKIFYILTLLISNAYLPLGYVKQVTIWVAIFYSRLCAQLILKQQWIEMGGSTYRRIYFSSRYNLIHGWLNPQMWSLQIRGNLQVRSNLHVGRNLCVLGMCTCVLSQQVKINVAFPLIG